MNLPATFPKSARLLKAEAFDAVLTEGRRLARTPHFSLHAVASPSGAPRLGLIVGKRMEKKAVRRNAIKRVLRESFRLARAGLRAEDFVVRVTAGFPAEGLKSLKRAARAEAGTLFAAARRPAEGLA